MKITHNKVGQRLNVTDNAKAEKASKAAKAEESIANNKADSLKDLGNTETATKVNVSDRAQQMKKIKEAAMASPDVNEEKVARLQKMIDEGTYKVDAKSVADKMIDEELNWS